jgi:hypothetical protein
MARHYAALMYSDPGGQPQAPAATLRERPHLGLFVLVGGYATMLLGMLGLPLQDPFDGSRGRLEEIYFGTAAQLASIYSDTFPIFGGMAKIWWNWLALGMFALLAVAIAIAAALPAARRWLGWILVVLTLGTAGLYTAALQQTGDIYRLARGFQRGGSTWETAGSGVWVGYAGLGVMLLGALITGLLKSRAVAEVVPAAPAPYPPAGWQQGGPGLGTPPPWQTQPSPYAQGGPGGPGGPGGSGGPPATHPNY